MRRLWLALSLCAACGSPGNDERPAEVHPDPEEPEAPQEPEAPEPPSGPECTARAPTSVATGPAGGLWTVAAGSDGYALAYCNGEGRAEVRVLDADGAPRGDARALAQPCTQLPPRLGGVGERWVLSTHGPCGETRMRRTRCFHHIALGPDGAPLGEPIRTRRSFLEGNSRAQVATTSTTLYSSESEWDRGGGGDFSIDEQLTISSAGTLSITERNHGGDDKDCWSGACVATEGDRAVALLSDYDNDANRRGGLWLWRSWAEEMVPVRPLPWTHFFGSSLALCDGSVWIGYSVTETQWGGPRAVSYVSRIDAETGRAESWLDQLDPAPPMPSCTRPVAVRRGGTSAVEWHDARGRRVGEPVVIEGAVEQAVGDASRALAVGRDGESFLAAAVQCSTPRDGAREAREPAGAIAARDALSDWGLIAGIRGHELAAGSTRTLSSVTFHPPNRLRREPPWHLGEIEAPALALRWVGEDLVVLDSTPQLHILPDRHRSRVRSVAVEGALSLTTDQRYAYVGSAGAIVRVGLGGEEATIDGRVEIEGLRAVDLTIADRTLYAALASDEAGAVQAIDLRGAFASQGRVDLDRPAVAIDSDRTGVVVATASSLHQVTREGDALQLGASATSEAVHDLAVGGGRVFTVGPGGRVLEHALGESGADRELAPRQQVAGEEGRWLLRATRDLLLRVGEDRAVIVVPEADRAER